MVSRIGRSSRGTGCFLASRHTKGDVYLLLSQFSVRSLLGLVKIIITIQTRCGIHFSCGQRSLRGSHTKTGVCVPVPECSCASPSVNGGLCAAVASISAAAHAVNQSSGPICATLLCSLFRSDRFRFHFLPFFPFNLLRLLAAPLPTRPPAEFYLRCTDFSWPDIGHRRVSAASEKRRPAKGERAKWEKSVRIFASTRRAHNTLLLSLSSRSCWIAGRHRRLRATFDWRIAAGPCRRRNKNAADGKLKKMI